MFVKVGTKLVPEESITSVDLERLEELEVVVRHADGVDVVRGIDALEAVMVMRPSALEGKRFRWVRGAWAFHNLVGHPLMQLCAWLGAPKLGMKIHDGTVPRPVGGR